MTRNTIMLRVLNIGMGKRVSRIPLILLSKQAREETGFELGEIVRVKRSGCTAYAGIDKQLKSFANEKYGCSLSLILAHKLPCLPDDEVVIEAIGEEMYGKLSKFEIDDLENVKRLVSVQEIGLLVVKGYDKKSLNKAVSMQCMSKMFTTKIEQALRGVEDFKISVGRIGERYSHESYQSKTLCNIAYGEIYISVGFKPTTNNKAKKNKFQVYISKPKKRVHCMTLNDALDKTLKEISKVINDGK